MELVNKILVDNIVFLKEDTFKDTLIKTVQIWAGTHRLKTELAKHKIDYVKIERGATVKYILRGAQIGKIEVKL
jgi:hypothetical protein